MKQSVASFALCTILAAASIAAPEKILTVTPGSIVKLSESPVPDKRDGVWQYPELLPIRPGVFAVLFQRHPAESAERSIDNLLPPGCMITSDDGRSWQEYQEHSLGIGVKTACFRATGDLIYLEPPKAMSLPAKLLPQPVGSIKQATESDILLYPSSQMPQGTETWFLKRLQSGQDTWARIPVTLDDPAAVIEGYKQTGKPDVIIKWRDIRQIVQLKDATLLAVLAGHRLDASGNLLPGIRASCLASTDGGITWKYKSSLVRDAVKEQASFTNPTLAVMPDASVFAVLEAARQPAGQLFWLHSTDNGATWTAPTPMPCTGVEPRLLSLKNGVTVLAAGQEKPVLAINPTGKTGDWRSTGELPDSPETVQVTPPRPGTTPAPSERPTLSSGHTSMAPLSHESFLLAFDRTAAADSENAAHEIVVRKVTAGLRDPPKTRAMNRDWVVNAMAAALVVDIGHNDFQVATSKGSTGLSSTYSMPNISAGVGSEYSDFYLDLTGGLGVFLADQMHSFFALCTAAGYWEVSRSLQAGPHVGLLYFMAPDWRDESANIELSGSAGFYGGLHFTMGDKITYLASVDLITASFSADAPTGTTAADSIDILGLGIQFGVRGQF